MIYEIINPSDAVTFHAPDDTVARAVVLLIGRGMYGLEGPNGSVSCLLAFASDVQTQQALREWFGDEESGLSRFVDQHRDEVLAALDSVQNVSCDKRKEYDDELLALLEEKREAYRKKTESKNRTSLTCIVKHAWEMAEHVRRCRDEEGAEK